MISVELHVVGGKHAGQVIPLNRKKFLIGRESDCQLRPNSELVSRHHCIFSVDDFSVRIRDLGSTNGTLVNDERIRKEVVLQPKDKVTVGNLEFEIVVNEVSDVSDQGQISAAAEETVVGGTDTVTEMPSVEAPDTQMPAEAAAPAAEPVPAAPAPAQEADPAPPPVDATQALQIPPQGSTGDTTIIQPAIMMPGQQPYQPMMPQQMGYPQMYGNMPYPQAPGQMPVYPQQPGYPQQMPGYPAQQQTPAPPVAPAQPEPVEAPAGTTITADGMAVSLPDPESTGAKAEAPKPPSSDGGSGSEEVKSNQSAADIIQQQRNRRPGS